jgi:hypothetical protein
MKNLHILLSIFIASAFFLLRCSNPSASTQTNADNSKKSSENLCHLIEAQSVCQIKIGMDIDQIVTSDLQKLTQKTIKRTGEEGDIEEYTVFTLLENDEEMLQLTGDTEKNVDEIFVISPKIKTAAGIGNGSSIDDFIKAYPDFKIYYSYIMGNFWLETKSLNAQFKIDPKNYHGLEDNLMKGDLVEIERNLLKNDAEIYQIRLFAL